MTPRKVYTLQKNNSGRKNPIYSITIPPDIAERLFQRELINFTVHMVEDGILLRPVAVTELEDEIPRWLR